MGYGNLDDIQKLRGGTMNFTYQDIAYRGMIGTIDYVPVGPGGVNVTLVSLQPVTEGPAVPDIPLNFTFSFFMAEVENKSRELIINQLVPDEGFESIISCRVKD